MAEPNSDLNNQAKQIQELIEQIEAQPDAEVRKLMAECLQAVLALHGSALARMLEIVENTGAKEAYDELIDEPSVRGMLLIHGLHPLSLETRLQQALDRVLPYVHSHGGNIELVGVRDGVATLRMQGACESCPSSSATLELAVRRAIEETCPDLLELEVEGMAAQPADRGEHLHQISW